MRATAILAGKIKSWQQAHHIIPKNLARDVIERYGSWFKKKFGYDLADWIHSMENCMGWDPKTHGALWRKYEKALEKWLTDNPNASWEQFLNFAKQLSKNMQNGGG